MLKYSQGTWTVDTHTGDILCNGKVIARVHGATFANEESNAQECWDNAMLISCAPLLYEMVRHVTVSGQGLVRICEMLEGRVDA